MKKQLNANHLKLIAIIAMTVDHLSDLIFPGYPMHPASLGLHLIGRLTAPIMWFFVCEGFYYTQNLKKYLLRMFIFAVISHFAYCFAFGISYIPFRDSIFNQTSVMWPLFWAVVALWIYNAENKLKSWHKYALLMLINVITFPSDWSCIAVMAILSMYDYRNDIKKQTLAMLCWVLMYALISFFFVSKVYGLIQMGVIFVYPLMKLYNGEKGKAKWMKWLFYLYYPAHLVMLGILRLIIHGDVPLLF